MEDEYNELVERMYDESNKADDKLMILLSDIVADFNYTSLSKETRNKISEYLLNK